MANTKVQSEQIEDGSITADKLADGTIVAAELADNAVETAAINADAVTGAKIADNAIDSEHYTDGSIDTAHIADAQITVGKMAANSVDSDQYVDGSIDTVHIADLQVTTAKIANGNISTAKIADNAVTSAKIDTNIDIAGTFDVTGATTLDSTLAVVGLTTLSGDLTLASSTANKPVLTLTDTNADSQGPDLVFRKDSSSPADNDELFRIYGYGDDDGGNATEGFLMLATMTDVSNGSEDTKVRMMTYGAGSQRDTLTLAGLNVGIGTASPSTKLHLGGTAPLDSIIRQDSTSSGTNWEIGERAAGKWQIFEDDNDSIVATFMSTGNVGIGTASPSKKLAISNGGAQGIELSPEESGVSRIFSYNRSSNAYTPLNIQGEYIMFGTGTSNAEKVRINAEGIAFNGDSAAANSLDDYEEGTHIPTPSISGATGAIAFNTTNNHLSYTKIGNVCHIQGTLQIASNSSGGGRLNITMPFTSQNGDGLGGQTIFHVQISGGTGSQASGYLCSLAEGGTTLQIQTYSGIGASNDSVVTMQADSFLLVSGTYITA